MTNDFMNVVSIDDNETNLLLIEAFCDDMNINLTSFIDPEEAFDYVTNNTIDMIMIDYMMPKLNGLDFIKNYREFNDSIPIIMITAVDEEKIHSDAFDLGANDFLTKPINVTLFKARVNNLLKLHKNTLLIEDKAKLLEEEVKKATQNLINREQETLQMLGKTAEFKDPETGAHISRVAHYSKMLAKEYGLDSKEQDLIFNASPFHDIGKIGIEDKILLKPARLNHDEFEVMKNHAKIGYEILKDSQSEYLKAGAIIALTHHEKFNGYGYPNKLKGEEIHIFGRIVAVADVFDALTSSRPYKKAWDFDDAIEFLKNEKGQHFDPVLVDLFINKINEVSLIFNSFQDEE